MNYSELKYFDIANGTGVRTTLFVSGCRNACPGCFQPETWDFFHGKPFDRSVEDAILTSLSPYYVEGLTLLGGEPFEPENQRALLPFLHRVRNEAPGKTIWAFSGCTLEQIRSGRVFCEVTEELLSLLDVLVDGPFIEAEKDITLRFRGSRNQRVLNLPETLRTGEPVLLLS